MTTKHKKLSDFRKEARHALTGKWVFAAEVTILFFVMSALMQTLTSVIAFAALLVMPVITYGYTLVVLQLVHGKHAKFETLFDGFSNRYGTILLAYIVMVVRTLLWSLLFIIPGIIAAYSYSQTFFILADNKDINALDAIEESKKMMRGNKWRFFLLSMSFIGWVLLAICTLFIGFIWLEPYIMITYAKFYESIKHSHKADEGTASVLE